METKIRLIVIFLLLGGWVSAQTAYDQKLQSLYENSVPQIKADELKEKLGSKQKLVLLDTRSHEEFKVSHIPGATFIDYDRFSVNDVIRFGKNAEVIVYCTVGARSENIGEKLLKMGFTNVKNLYGGIFQWVNEDGVVLNMNNHPTDSVHTYSQSWSKWLNKGIKVH